MKVSHLKKIVKEIVRETFSVKKEVMMGQERDDHRFDDGRSNGMRAVNLETKSSIFDEDNIAQILEDICVGAYKGDKPKQYFLEKLWKENWSSIKIKIKSHFEQGALISTNEEREIIKWWHKGVLSFIKTYGNTMRFPHQLHNDNDEISLTAEKVGNDGRSNGMRAVNLETHQFRSNDQQSLKKSPHFISKPVKNTQTGEWIVKWMTNGKRDENKTYYTDDEKDAWDTYKQMVKNASVMKENDDFLNNPEDKYNFRNGDKVKLTPQYAGQHSNEIFTLTQWNGNKGWIGDKNGRGWYVRGFQIVLARPRRKIGEKVGNDGRYEDDMESGVAVKKLHNLDEMSDSGGAGAYATPFAFSKDRMGSHKGIQAAKKYGTVVKSISETEENL